MTQWSEKIAHVTFGRSGISAAITAQFTSKGVKVFTAQRGRDLSHVCIQANFLDLGEPERVVSKVIEHVGRLDILVSNTEIMRESTTLETTKCDWAETLQVNLTVPFMLINHALPHLILGTVLS